MGFRISRFREAVRRLGETEREATRRREKTRKRESFTRSLFRFFTSQLRELLLARHQVENLGPSDVQNQERKPCRLESRSSSPSPCPERPSSLSPPSLYISSSSHYFSMSVPDWFAVIQTATAAEQAEQSASQDHQAQQALSQALASSGYAPPQQQQQSIEQGSGHNG